MKINTLMEALYLYLIEPKKAIKRNFDFKYTIIIYLISIFSISISALYSYNSSKSIVSILLLTILLSVYIITSNFVKISITSLIASMLSNHREQNFQIFTKNYFALYSVYILLLPITLLFSLSSNLGLIQAIIAFILQIYYLILIFQNIKYSFKIDNSLKAFVILLSPIILDFISYIALFLLILGAITKLI